MQAVEPISQPYLTAEVKLVRSQGNPLRLDGDLTDIPVSNIGSQPVTEPLPGWFEQYNGRQTIEAGIKESKQVFYLHHLKVRAQPASYLQEAFVLFAANFIRL